LAQSIAENGVLQPILVRVRGQGYEIIAGERRWRASRQAGLTQVPALVRELSDKEALVVALLENLQREDLNPLEEAQALERLQQEMDLSQGELAKHVCKSRPAVANSLRLLQLDTEIRQAVLDGQLSAGNARTIMGVSQKEARLSLFALVCKKGLSVRETEKAVAYYKEHGRLPAAYAPKGAAQPQSDPFLDQLRQALARQLPSKVQLLGTRDKGRISFRYESPEQLEQLLEALGAKIDLDVSRETP
jgi:ParB family chromosome partitioning protein